MKLLATTASIVLLSSGCGGGQPVPADGSVPTDTPVGMDTASAGFVGYVESVPPAAVTFTDACAMGARAMIGNMNDSLSSDIDMPFPFTLYRGSYSRLRVSVNGFVSFSRLLSSSGGRRAQGREMLPSFASPNAAIYALYEDLQMRDGQSICYATVGAAPSRSFVVQWNNAAYQGNTAAMGSLTFQVRLNEADSSIDILYQSITLASGQEMRPMQSTIGVENEETAMGTTGGTRAQASSVVPATGGRIRFTPMR